MNPDSILTSPAARKRGIALVMVLGFVALIAILVTAFFSSATTDLAASKSYSDGAAVKGLSDSAVSSVMGIIREATSGGSKVAWASQPGMLRTYDETGKPLKAYKLYSSNQMTETKYDPTKDVDTDWKLKPGLFTDLNRPITVVKQDGSSALRFPIVDPGAHSKYKSPSDSSPPVEGFELTPPSSYVESGPGGISPANNPAPMPVKWIYQLRDGTMVVPDTYKDGIATFTNNPKPSKSNPIVGRMAFWTDDETTKININTAAGDISQLTGTETGSFWDIPRAYTATDRKLTTSQVAANEFQRYPGHPATIALNAVMPGLSREQIGILAPRVNVGGSRGGTKTNYNLTTPDAAVRKGDRLYGTVDELLFQPNTSVSERDENLPNTGIVTPENLEKVRFFLTASSRVPEVNLFGQPRVSIWPVHEVNSPTYRTVSDNLLAFCSTVGGQRYHFTRGNASGSTSSDRDADYTGNARNQKLYAYLRNLMDKQIPGFGGPAKGFGDKYGALNRDQILTEIFDYIRITNLQDKSLAQAGRYTPKYPNQGSGQVLPIKITTPAGDTKGFGRMATISEAALQFYATEVRTSPSPAKTTKMRAVLILEAFNPAHGFSGLYPSYSHTVTGLEKLTITIGNQTIPLNFPATAENRVGGSHGYHARAIAGTSGFHNGFFIPGASFKSVPGLDPVNNYPFISQTDIDLSTATATTMQLNGATLNLTIRYKDNNGPIVQTVALKFPVISGLPLPTTPGNAEAIVTTNGNFKTMNYNDRITKLNDQSEWENIIDKNDVVRSLEPSGSPVNGDLRLVAAVESVPDTVFQPHASSSTNTRLAHSLKTGVNRVYAGSTNGDLIAGANYGTFWAPDMPSKITTGAQMSPLSNSLPGDWDNGVANYLDGPFINKADEGSTSSATAGGVQTGAPPYWNSNTDDFDASTLFSPNRQIASPVMFGSLSTGVKYSPQRPWQTLLFRPDAAGTHPGSAAPKDYLLLDLFTMPIVDPYAISEPLSTAGKVNMNYQIVPFAHIKRETAMRAALKSIWTMAIPVNQANVYKDSSNSNEYRFQVDADKTLEQFKTKFDSNEIFKAAAEICDLHLVAKGSSLATMKSPSYWVTYGLTGDNTREMPYNHLYPLLTTKSNTYTVHVWVETLKQGVPNNVAESDARWTQWNELTGQVTAQYRGSTLIERYIDPQDPRLVKFDETYTGSTVFDSAGNITKAGSLDPFYRFRVLNTKRFDR